MSRAGPAEGQPAPEPPFDAFARIDEPVAYWAGREAEIKADVEAALAAEGSVVVDVRSSLEAISAYTTLAKLHGGRGPPLSD